jgi:hypothetical protein
LPRTKRGKVDRAPLLAAHANPLRPEARAPQTDLEMYIASIWRIVLGIRDIGIEDDSFELGATACASRRGLHAATTASRRTPRSCQASSGETRQCPKRFTVGW